MSCNRSELTQHLFDAIYYGSGGAVPASDEIDRSKGLSRHYSIDTIGEAARIGCVYFIWRKYGIKIDHTYNLRGRMLMELPPAGDPTERLIRVINTDRPEELEAELHEKFKSRLIRDKWFNISIDDVYAIEYE